MSVGKITFKGPDSTSNKAEVRKKNPKHQFWLKKIKKNQMLQNI